MKILVISDSHGRTEDVEGVLEQVGPIDVLVHCGDIVRSADYIELIAECPVYMVEGNNDFRLGLDREVIFEIEGHKVLVVHGHQYYVNVGTGRLEKHAMEQQVDIVLYGHTHEPDLKQKPGLTIMNPGSISYPRQLGRIPTFGVIEIDPYGNAHFSHVDYKRSRYGK